MSSNGTISWGWCRCRDINLTAAKEHNDDTIYCKHVDYRQNAPVGDLFSRQGFQMRCNGFLDELWGYFWYLKINDKSSFVKEWKKAHTKVKLPRGVPVGSQIPEVCPDRVREHRGWNAVLRGTSCPSLVPEAQEKKRVKVNHQSLAPYWHQLPTPAWPLSSPWFQLITNSKLQLFARNWCSAMTLPLRETELVQVSSNHNALMTAHTLIM